MTSALCHAAVIGVLALILGGLFYPLLSRLRQRARAPVEAPAMAAAEGPAWRLDDATAFSALLVVAFAWALWASRDFGVRAGLFPWAVCAPGLALGLAQLARDLRGRREKPAADDAEGVSAPDLPPELVRRRTIEICLWITAFWLAIWLLGFSLATLVTTFLYLRISARERWTMCVTLTACASAFVYGLFEKGLGVPFPDGQLLVWLGLIR